MELTAAEQRVVEAALALGWLEPAQVERARAECAGSGQSLLTLLRRHLTPAQAQQLGKVYEEALRGSARAAAQAQRRLGPYVVTGELGRGGMGIVYRAVAPDGQERAVKVLLGVEGTRRARFAREVAVLEFVGRHANVVSLHDSGEDQGTPWLAMDLLTGGSLAGRLAQTPRDVRALVLHLAVIANALHFAHEAGVLHRDIKPSNILYDAQGAPCLADFGLAADAEDLERLTRTGDLMGTIGHMPPEQLRQDGRSLDRRVDVYALGTVLYEVLTGRPPFEGPPLAVLSQVLSAEEPERPGAVAADVPPALEAACLRAMAKDPDARTPSAAAFQAELRAWLDGRPDAPRLETAGVAAPTRRTPAWVFGSMLASCALGVGGLVVARGASARASTLAAQAADRAEALALERATLGDPRRSPAASDEPALERIVELDPGRTASWAALGALVVARGDRDRAAACLARSAAPADDLRAARLASDLAEREGRGEAARDAALLAVLAGDDDPATLARLARCGARVADTQGLATTAEGLRWQALRADPSDTAPLEAILQTRLAAADVEALTAMWIDLRRALAGPSLADLVRESGACADVWTAALGRLDPPPSVDEAPRMVNPLDLAPGRPLARRLLAALDAAEAGPPSADLERALRELTNEVGEPPLLAEAARASLVALGLHDVDDVPGRLLASPWPGLTLLEGATRRRAPVTTASLQAQDPMVRAAAVLTNAIACSRACGLGASEVRAAQAAVATIESDPAPLPAGCARRAGLALGSLQDPARGPDAPLDAALLAWSLVRLPCARMAAWRERVHAALERRTDPAARRALALDAVAAGDLDAARAALEGAPRDDERCDGLRAALAALRGEPAPPVRDPLAARRAATLAELAAATGVVFTAAPAGAVRADVPLGAGRFPGQLLERWSVEDPVTNPEGLDTGGGPLRVRLRLPLARVDALLVEGRTTGEVDWHLALGDVGAQLNVSREKWQLRLPSHSLQRTSRAPVIDSLGLSALRGGVFAVAGNELLEVRRTSTGGTRRAEVSVGTGWSKGGHCVLELTVVGVWAGRLEPVATFGEAPPALTPELGVSFVGAARAPTTFGELVRDGVTLTPSASPSGEDRLAQAAIDVPLAGDVDVSARVTLAPGQGNGERLAGFALRDTMGKVFVTVGVRSTDAQPEPRAWASVQVPESLEWPAGGARFTPGEPVFLRLRRRGDALSLEAGPSPDRLVGVCGLVVQPLGGPVTLALLTRRLGRGEAGSARFEQLQVHGTPVRRRND